MTFPIMNKNGDNSRPAAEPRIQSLKRADDILSAVSNAGSEGIRLNELAMTLNLNKTTVFNLVRSLAVLGYVRQDRASRAYRLGDRAMELALRQRSNDAK